MTPPTRPNAARCCRPPIAGWPQRRPLPARQRYRRKVARATDRQTLPVGGAKPPPGQGNALLAFGSMLAPAPAAGEELDATVANMRFVKPLDRELILRTGGGSHDAAGQRRRERRDRRRRFRWRGSWKKWPEWSPAPPRPARPIHRSRRPGDGCLAELGPDRDGIVCAVASPPAPSINNERPQRNQQ